ncbi:MAG: cyclopropane-fatty-acyl-phospholipid synthase family protein [Candidatus Melainabacteria bacterium]|nr:cyclopropane-fatty-acyl-phospholipid synthase family protein [Candidatus Melainabacteria bacterium]
MGEESMTASMEKKGSKQSNSSLSGFAAVVSGLLERLPYGKLTLYQPDGEKLVYGREHSVHGKEHPRGRYVEAQIKVLDNNFFSRVVMFGHIGFAESFMDGEWQTDDIASVVAWFLLNLNDNPLLEGTGNKSILVNALGALNQLLHLFKFNNKDNSRKNISYHYDLSNDLFELFLDETMTYSSARFSDDWLLSLKDAQISKYEALCRKLKLKEGDSLLEIGCGWGGFAQYAVSKYRIKYTGITISKEQLAYAEKAFEKLPELSGLVEFKLIDYRDMKRAMKPEGYDKIVSIEMIEAVGDEYYDAYFAKIDELLAEDGLAAIQMITCPDNRYDLIRKNTDFIQKHIFPGSLLPCLHRISKATSLTRLSLFEVEDLGNSYAKTLFTWQERFEAQLKKVGELGFDQVFVRKWRYYLSYCAAAFAMRNISVVQAVYSRPNNLNLCHSSFLERFAAPKNFESIGEVII